MVTGSPSKGGNDSVSAWSMYWTFLSRSTSALIIKLAMVILTPLSEDWTAGLRSSSSSSDKTGSSPPSSSSDASPSSPSSNPVTGANWLFTLANIASMVKSLAASAVFTSSLLNLLLMISCMMVSTYFLAGTPDFGYTKSIPATFAYPNAARIISLNRALTMSAVMSRSFTPTCSRSSASMIFIARRL